MKILKSMVRVDPFSISSGKKMRKWQPGSLPSNPTRLREKKSEGSAGYTSIYHYFLYVRYAAIITAMTITIPTIPNSVGVRTKFGHSFAGVWFGMKPGIQ